MILIISPSKTLDFSSHNQANYYTNSDFVEESFYLIKDDKREKRPLALIVCSGLQKLIIKKDPEGKFSIAYTFTTQTG